MKRCLLRLSLQSRSQITFNNYLAMYNEEKAKLLENRSHVRGILSKQMYGQEQSERQRKRREMKQNLDRQVEQRRRQKEKEQEEMQRRLRKEEEDIHKYLKDVERREKPLPTIPKSTAQEEVNFVTLMKDGRSGKLRKQGKEHKESHLRDSKDHREMHSDRKSVHYQDIPQQIPLMPPIDQQMEAAPPQQQIPVLDLNDDSRKRKKTKGREGGPGRRKETHSRLDTINSRKNTESGLKELEVENQNRRLKQQLKRSQQAITLMLSVLKSNPKLEKFRMQAERILHGGQNQYGNTVPTKESRKSQGSRFFPTLSFNSQGSIMKDYLLIAAKHARRAVSSSRGILKEK